MSSHARTPPSGGSVRNAGGSVPRRAASGAPATTTTRRPSSSSSASTGLAPSRLVHPDEADGYITNLKGQIYLLSLENELLKKAEAGAVSEAYGYDGAPAPNSPLGMRATPMPYDQQQQHSQQHSQHQQQQMYSDTPPGSIGEIEAMMRSKFREQASKYETEIAERKKAEATLATQTAAQSGLITSLRQELSTAQGLMAEQKTMLQTAQQAVEAESVQRKSEARRLQLTIKRLEREAEGIKKEVESRDLALADGKCALAAAEAAKLAAEQVHALSIDEYSVLAAKDVAHAEVVQMLKQKIEDGLSELQKLKVDKADAVTRGDALEAEVLQAKAAATQAYTARDEALATVRGLRARVAQLEEEVRRADSEKATRKIISEVHDKKLAAVTKRVESAESATAQAVKERDAALERCIAVERRWAVLAAESDRSKRHAADAGKQAAEEGARAGELSEELAQARGRVSALETSAEMETRRITELEARLADETAGHIALGGEVAALREELGHRPPVDVLQTLEVQSLLQRNMEAATAVKGLLDAAKRGGLTLANSRRRTAAATSGGDGGGYVTPDNRSHA